MPEVGGAKWSMLNPGCPTIMLVQGIDFVFADAQFERRVEGGYPGWPQATGAVAMSQAIEGFLVETVAAEFPVHRVAIAIDATVFTPAAKEQWVALMPRRRREDLLAAVQLLHRRGRFAAGWRPVLIDGMDEEQVAGVLGRSAIFLSGAEREGFGLPGAEAMAAGCRVIGFTGHGAREYLTPELAVPIPESDVVALARAVATAMDEFDSDRESFVRRGEKGRTFVCEHYSQGAQDRDLTAAFAALTQKGAPSVLTDPHLAYHFQSRSPGTPLARAWVSARSRGGALRRRVRGQ